MSTYPPDARPEGPVTERLGGKVAIVTGASRGIGRALARGLAREGARVVLAARSTSSRERLPGSIHTVAAEIEAAGGVALPVPVDARNDEDIEGMARTALDRFGRIDILIHNAGALWWQDVRHTPMKRFDLVMDVNVRGAFSCIKACLEPMIAGGGGHILLSSPPIDLDALPGKTAYLISKFGMTLLALGLAEEVRSQGIAVNTLWPATAIESQATVNYRLGSPATWRTPDILVDATLEIVTTPPPLLTGRTLLDEDFLRERGVTDFARYRCDPAHEPPRLSLRDLPPAGPTPAPGRE